MEKRFKAFDKVLIKRSWRPEWMCDLYSHYNENSEKPYHTTLTLSEVKDENILPYEGNEHLVGTTDSPDEEVRLEEGECCVFSDDLESFEKIKDLIVDKFQIIDRTENAFWQDGEPNLWKFSIRFKDFNPDDMKETRKHFLCVKGGKIVKYKG